MSETIIYNSEWVDITIIRINEEMKVTNHIIDQLNSLEYIDESCLYFTEARRRLSLLYDALNKTAIAVEHYKDRMQDAEYRIQKKIMKASD